MDALALPPLIVPPFRVVPPLPMAPIPMAPQLSLVKLMLRVVAPLRATIPLMIET